MGLYVIYLIIVWTIKIWIRLIELLKIYLLINFIIFHHDIRFIHICKVIQGIFLIMRNVHFILNQINISCFINFFKIFFELSWGFCIFRIFWFIFINIERIFKFFWVGAWLSERSCWMFITLMMILELQFQLISQRIIIVMTISLIK